MEDSMSGARIGHQALPLSANYVPKKKKQRVKSSVVHSQPADDGPGKHISTQLFMIVDTLKKRNAPMSLRDLSILTQSNMENIPDLLERFESHERVMKNPINGLYSYQFEHEVVASRDDLLKEIKSHARRGGGLSVQSLKQRWAGSAGVIEKLEQDGLVLITRAPVKTAEGIVSSQQADGKAVKGPMKMVFWNDIPPSDGGGKIDPEFQAMWSTLKWPAEAELIPALHHLGQTPARTSNAPLRARDGKKKGKKGTRQRQAKIQNTHLEGIDLTKDYVPNSSK